MPDEHPDPSKCSRIQSEEIDHDPGSHILGISNGVQSDIDCLKSIKHSLEDPYGYLNTSWNFNNNTEGFICKFTGVKCWHPNENKVLNLRLSDMGVKGRFPQGIKNCTSLTGLDLSNNELSGPQVVLRAFSDADSAGDPTDRRSTTASENARSTRGD
uniref:Leucine-rich repeat-containing N-terminal plant-type domain-containing protein n=1 Tax=Quercus lobata TaxID=97700 RepID=A0A7N2MSN1_QUELO